MKYLMKAPGNYMKSVMKYPGAKNEISIENARQPYEKRNEISWGKEWKIFWKGRGLVMKSTMKYPDILMKNLMKAHWHRNEIVNENLQDT